MLYWSSMKDVQRVFLDLTIKGNSDGEDSENDAREKACDFGK